MVMFNGSIILMLFSSFPGNKTMEGVVTGVNTGEQTAACSDKNPPLVTLNLKFYVMSCETKHRVQKLHVLQMTSSELMMSSGGEL